MNSREGKSMTYRNGGEGGILTRSRLRSSAFSLTCANNRMNTGDSAVSPVFSLYLKLAVPWTKGRRARWYRLPFSLFLNFFVAQGLDPGIYLMHPGKGVQRTQ